MTCRSLVVSLAVAILLLGAMPVRAQTANQALSSAAANVDLPRIRAALQAGADPNALDSAGNPAVVTLVMGYFGTDPQQRPDKSEALRGLAALLDRGAEVDGAGRLGLTAFSQACVRNDVDLVTFLVRRGTDINRKAGFLYETCLHLLAAKNNVPAIEVLLDARAAVNVRDGQGATPLVWAAQAKGDIGSGAISLLLERGADVNARANGGWTPLHAAAGALNSGAVRLLIEGKANVEAMDAEGKTPLDWAVKATEGDEAKRAATVALLKAAKGPAPAAASPQAKPGFPLGAAVTRFPRGPERPDDIAVIIANADYSKQGKDIPNVTPAYADGEGMRLYATQALGVKEANVIFVKDATGSQMTRIFGSREDHRGQLFDWIKPGKSRVFVYYSGHGAPAASGGSPHLIPADADAARVALNGYPLHLLYDNLGKQPAESITLVLEACFSGVSQAGSLIGNASPVFLDVKAPQVPANLTVIAAGAANQMASWEQDGSAGLFTKHFLEGMAGKADSDKDGKVTLDELDRHLVSTVTYLARRYYGRDQTPQIVKGGGN
jgi:ankyrin repeat protein